MAINWGEVFSLKRTPTRQDVGSPRRWIPGAANYKVNEDSAMTVSAYYRGVNYIATQIAKLPWDVKDRENNIQEDKVYSLLNLAPNPEMNALTFRVWLIMQAINGGNGYAEIERDLVGRPVALWPIHNRSVDMIRAYDGTLFYRVTEEKKEIFIPVRDMFHLKNFHTKDGIVGQGLVAYASQTLGISLAADGFASSLFANSGMPSGVLTHPETLSDEAYLRLKKSWEEQQGGRKTGGVAILEEGVKYDAVNMDPEVLQFLESRKFGVLEVARFLGIPPTKLFDATAATYSNVENSNLEVATDTLDAWACNLEIEADVKLLNNRFGGRYTELDLYAVFRGDMKTRADYFSKMMQSGAITPNQIRRREGQPGYPGGDRYYIAVNNFTPADRVDEVLDANIESKKAKANPPPQENNKSEGDEDTELKKAAVAYLTSKQ